MHRTRARLWALALGALLMPVGLTAQQNTYTLTGRIRDAETNGPLVGVQVAIRGTRFGGLTNNQGVYSVLAQVAPGSYEVQAQMIGRETSS